MLTLSSSARILTWSVTFAYLKYWGFVIMSVVGLASTLPFFVQWKKYGSSQALLGAIVAMFGPCMVVNDFGRIFLSTGLVNSLFSILSLIGLTCLVRFDKVIVSHPKVFRTDIFHNKTSLTNITTEEIFQNEHPFFVYVISLLALWIISIGAIVLLHKYLDPIKRFKISKFFSKCLTYAILVIIFSLMPMAFIVIVASLLMFLAIFFPFILLDLLFYFLYKITTIYYNISDPHAVHSLHCCIKIFDYVFKDPLDK